MNRRIGSITSAWALGAVMGAATMYLLDPNRGRQRRAQLQDQALKAGRHASQLLDAGVRDLSHRLSALPHRLQMLVESEHLVDDLRLIERVRSKMGRYVSHPAAIVVSALDGEVILSGSILETEHREAMPALRHVPGVREIVDRLTVYQRADGIPELQGQSPRGGGKLALLQEHWPPGIRFGAAASAGLLAVYGLRRSGFAGGLAAAAATALLTRSVANRPLHQLVERSMSRVTQPQTKEPKRESLSVA
ncbi:MAG TPA: BON domain-containing protein [Burkholderiales bacterium]|nr:BON domain-containing protein [Burkholderiales bacterium]